MTSKKNYWLRSGAYSILQRFGAFIFGFASYFLLVRYLSIDDFGVWTLFVVITSSLEMARSSFIQNAFVKFYNDESNDKVRLFSSSLLLNSISTSVFILAMVVLIPVLTTFWKTDQIGTLILWYCVTSVILVPLTQINYLEQANHSFRGVFWSTVMRQAFFFAIVVVCFFFFKGMPLYFFAAAQSVSAIVGLFIAYSFSRRMLPSAFIPDMQLVKKLYKFGRYILGTGITSTIGKNTDQVLLGAVSHNMVAIYNAGVRVLNFIEIPTLAISNIVYPKIAEKGSNEGPHQVGLMYEKSVASIVGIILPAILFIFIFPEFVLTIIAGAKYIEAASSLRIMVLASLLLPFNVQVGSACEVTGKPQVSFMINLIANILNIFLNLILIKYYGLTGAAFAFAITVILIFISGQYYVQQKMNVSIFRIFVQIINFYKSVISKVMVIIKERKLNV